MTKAAPSVSPAQPLITLHDAGAQFGSTLALAGVSLSLQRGDRLALVGANGSGKTSLLRLLHGLLPAAHGRGTRLAHALHPEGRAPVSAMVFQRPFLLNLPVHWNVQLGLWLQGVPAAERRTRSLRALARVGLVSLADRAARTLSGGQQQRLALARAWALKPDILFLDEPTASLDPSAKREVEDLMADFASEGVTLVFSTHNLGQAKRLATRVAYLEAGRLVVERPVRDFFERPGLPEQAQQFLKGELPWIT